MVFAPQFPDLVIEAFSRIQIRPTMLSPLHMTDARMSANLLLAEWITKPHTPSLWKIALLSIPLIQGVPTYNVPSNVVAILDSYIRQYYIGSPVNVAPQFSTTALSPTVQVYQPQHGLVPGNWISITVPVSVGGLVLQNFYQVVSVVDVNDYTITASANAVTTVVAGGVVPVFTTTLNSSTVTVTLPNHGLYANANFSVQVLTQIAGLQLFGLYNVVAVVDVNNFTITATGIATQATSVTENGGNAQIAPQLSNAAPFDRVQYPISRTEYADQPNKFQQSPPNTFWFDRLINPTITFWEVPDQNGPYVYYYYALTNIEEVDFANAPTPDIPYRFLEAFASGLAAKLARKYPPSPASGITVNDLKMEAELMWKQASEQDVEDVPIFISPGLRQYYS